MVKAETSATRDEKLENLIKNHTMIFMAMFEEAFTTIAEKMTEVLAVGASGIAEALGGLSPDPTSPTSDIGKTIEKEIAPELKNGIQNAFSGIRAEIDSQWPKDASAFRDYVASPVFDKAIETVEKYDFHLPKLTQKLSDEVLASYVVLLKNDDKELGTMFKELADLMSTLPRPPWAKQD